MSSAFVACLLLLLLLFLSTFAETPDFGGALVNSKEGRRLEKRSLLAFPPDSLLQVTMGVTVAGKLERNNGVIVLAFQQNAPLPKDPEPLLAPSLIVTGRQFSTYDYLRDVIASYGFDRSQCLRKMICQIGEAPLFGGLLEELITFALSPSKHRVFNNPNAEEWNSFVESEKLGRLGGNCTSAFPQCVRTPLDMISSFVRV